MSEPTSSPQPQPERVSSFDTTMAEARPDPIMGASPDVTTLLNRLMADKEDMDHQTAAQAGAWNAQEAQMLQQIRALQARLADSEARLNANRTASQTDTQTALSSNVPDVPMMDGNEPNTTSQTALPRKRRRTADTSGLDTEDTVTIPTESPHIITRLEARRRDTLANTHNALPGLSQPDTNPQPEALPAFTFSSAVIDTAPMPKSVKKKKVVKSAAEVYRYLPQETPSDIGGLKKAMALHIRILWALLDAKDVPQDPPVHILSNFKQRFSDESQLYSSQESGRELVPRHLIQVGTAMSSVRGRIAHQARLVEEHMLGYIQACLSKFGLTRWCPDLQQPAYSLYNAACRIVALDTFKQALISHAYLHLNPNTTYVTNMPILIRIYDHIVFHYMRARYEMEHRHPGLVAQQLKNNPQYVARIRLAAARLKFLVENNYPQRYRDLIDSKATSDDEYDPSQKAWIIKRCPERSPRATKFFRILDQKREQAARQESPRKWRERRRITPTEGNEVDSQFHSLPEGMPVDYYSVTFFNQLQPKTRNRIAIKKVALLPDVDQSLTWNADERISDKAFTKKYGVVLKRYAMVSDEDMAGLADSEDNADGDDDWAIDDDEIDEMSDMATVREHSVDLDTINSSRNSLSAHLSASASDFSQDA